MTSPLVSRPSLPLAGMAVASTLLSSTSLRTAGPERSNTDVSPFAAVAAAGLAGGFAGAFASLGAAAAGAAAGFGAAVAFAAPAPMMPSTAPTATLDPSGTTISESTPAAGAFTSSVTLSVSSSTSGSSTATASPSYLSQRDTVASFTDSPNAGTLTSVAISAPPSPHQPVVKASSTSLACSVLCRFKRPVAVAAASGRPA